MQNELIHGLPFDEYLQLDCLSKSTLTAILRSPAHLQRRLVTPFVPSAVMEFGSAVDCLLFDGKEVFAANYAIRPDGMNLTTKAGKAWKADQGSRVVVPADVLTCNEAIMTSAALDMLLNGHSQVSMTWQDEATGIWLRGRPDVYIPSEGTMDVPMVMDLKTTGDADAEVWGKLAFNLKYHWQAAMYCDGLTAVTGEPHDEFLFVVAEREPPHRVEIYRTPISILEQGRAEYQEALQLYANCKALGEWPASTGEIGELEFPGWARR